MIVPTVDNILRLSTWHSFNAQLCYMNPLVHNNWPRLKDNLVEFAAGSGAWDEIIKACENSKGNFVWSRYEAYYYRHILPIATPILDHYLYLYNIQLELQK